MYLSRIPSGYVFRRAIPAELRPILGKREFKIALGTDYATACRRAREEAFRSDSLLDNARTRLGDQAALSRQPFARYEALPAITTVTEELKQQVSRTGSASSTNSTWSAAPIPRPTRMPILTTRLRSPSRTCVRSGAKVALIASCRRCT